MPFRRSYRGRRGKRRRSSYKSRRYSRGSAATKIQRRWRVRRKARSMIGRSIRRSAAKKLNYKRGSIVYKTFTLTMPDYMITHPSIDYPNQGIICSGGAGILNEVFELGSIFKSPNATNGVEACCSRFEKYCQLFKQTRMVRAKLTLLHYAGKQGDQAYPAQTAAGSYFGTHQYVNQIHGIIDTGSSNRKILGTGSLTDLALAPLSNLYSSTPDTYLAIPNSSLKQISWDKHKGLKYDILKPGRLTEWNQQRVGLVDAMSNPTGTQRLNLPWLDTRLVTGVTSGTWPAGNPNYQNVYSLMRLPPLSLYGSGFPIRVETLNGAVTTVEFPLFKALISITCAFRVPNEV